ncbi:CBS-domain-containing protein [Nadsonia fulvescens var. elongata DSM 6958]|uniref:CBS-domain-containing protein n=1 Tax=Nadsonia fulvescens var. elongata DSM 6958 TaxID=857566 RepID=A0A1E3PMU8_9ASCO|nr:CBS-domain-containing protein [Nadsonia fulvescens var. elongata DSM 6958]
MSNSGSNINLNSASSTYGGSPGHSNSSTPVNDSLTDGRKRQNKRDEQIRRKLENDFSKKRKFRSKAPPGSVLSLRPSPALAIKPNVTIFEAAQRMSAKRENCVLVTDENEKEVIGIFTAKDLAFRVVGNKLDARTVTIDKIMTKSPLSVLTTSSATDALNLMVNKGFRHLPVMDEYHEIAGILDITKCFYEAMEKLERAYESSRKLHDALEGVQSEFGSNSQPAQIIHYVEQLKLKMEGPDLESVLADRAASAPVYVDIRTNVVDAAQLMKQNHTTAVLVTDEDKIAGIFTSKDIVLRVIAAGLDPKNCKIVRVMTPHPDFASKTMSIQAALRKMHDGHYLNLPVIDNELNEIIGIVDVLKLTYATLEQINGMQTSDAEGPAWNKFWMSLGGVSHGPSTSNGFASPYNPTSSTNFNAHIPSSELAQFNVSSTNSELNASEWISLNGDSLGSQIGNGYEEMSFPFKFKTPTGRVHRVTIIPNSGVTVLRKAIDAKLSTAELQKLAVTSYAISYIDDEGDIVAITSDQDLLDAVLISRKAGLEKADLFIHHPDSSIDLKPKEIENHNDNDISTQSPQEQDIANEGDISKRASNNNLLLPGAISVLAASIVLVFSFGRK